MLPAFSRTSLVSSSVPRPCLACNSLALTAQLLCYICIVCPVWRVPVRTVFHIRSYYYYRWFVACLVLLYYNYNYYYYDLITGGGVRTYKIQASETLQGHTEPEAHKGGRLISRQCLSKQTDKDSRRQKGTKCTTKVWTNVNMRTIKQEAKTNVNENVIERQKPQ